MFLKFLKSLKRPVNQSLVETIYKGYQTVFESIKAYHGTGHDFTKFLTEKVGTGEGIQKFGHGLYFTGSKKVAEYYAKETVLSSKDNIIYLATLHKGYDPDYASWDEPMNHQQMQKTLTQAKKENWKEDDIEDLNEGFGLTEGYRDQPVNTDSIYSLISSILGEDKQASEFLLRAGIDGIKYKSGTLSGIDDSEFFNYVVFDQDEITIEEKKTI
jgi:hypothetical protein